MQPDRHDLPDEALLLAYRHQDDRQALGVLYRRYAHLVLGLCLDYLKNREDARDAVMDIFEKAALKLRQQEVKTFRTWIYTVSRNHCLDLLRRRIKSTPREFFDEVFVESVPEDRLLEEQRIERLSEAIAELKPQQRECIVLFYLQGRSYEEVAVKTGFSGKEVKSHLQNGRRNLRNLLLQPDHE